MASNARMYWRSDAGMGVPVVHHGERVGEERRRA
ncbi:MAG: hypothetical protein QOD72_1823, partial [Acidimicrobiaceae bacterium]|nr:hypothetical protein [Acidimicrobiaceae bacterium]